MHAQVLGFPNPVKKLADWIRNHESDIAVALHGSVELVMVATLAALWATANPPAAMTSTDPLPYLPANYELVLKVTNTFQEHRVIGGGAGGVGHPQVERSIDAYQQTERDTVHFLTIRSARMDGSVTALDYWDFQPEKVIHAIYTYPSPSWQYHGLTVAYYGPVKGRVENNSLVVERAPGSKNEFYFLIFLLWLVAALFYGAAAAMIINPFLLRPLFSLISWLARR